MKRYWEIIADNLSKAGWTWGCVATVDAHGRTIFVADAHRGDGKRYVVHADEKLTAFLELGKSHARIIALPKYRIIRHYLRHAVVNRVPPPRRNKLSVGAISKTQHLGELLSDAILTVHARHRASNRNT